MQAIRIWRALLHQEVQGQRSYTVQEGDTPYDIAGRNDVTLADLYALNPQLDNGNYMMPGMELVIGQAVPVSAGQGGRHHRGAGADLL